MSVTKLTRDALALNPNQRLRLVQDIWDSLIKEPQGVPVPEAHKRLIHDRLGDHERNPDAALSLAEVKRRVQKNLAKRRK